MKVQTQQKKEKSDIAVYPSGSEATTPVFHKVKYEHKEPYLPLWLFKGEKPEGETCRRYSHHPPAGQSHIKSSL